MLGAGKDCTDLFNKYHRWVNIDSMLGKCLVGHLLPDEKLIISEADEEEEGEEGETEPSEKKIESEAICKKEGLSAKESDNVEISIAKLALEDEEEGK
jgi:hypothetical protein